MHAAWQIYELLNKVLLYKLNGIETYVLEIIPYGLEIIQCVLEIIQYVIEIKQHILLGLLVTPREKCKTWIKIHFAE